MPQSAGTGPTTRLKKKWMSTRYATAISHILPSQHRATIYLGETSFHTFTAFGSITQRAQFQYNDAVKNLRILKVNRYKNDLKTQTDIAGALWMYRSIKRSMVRTMKLGFGETNDRNKDSEDLIKTKEEWYECLRALREAADLLIKWDWAPDVDDANEFLRRFTLDRNPEIEKEYAAWKEAHTPTVCQIAFLTALQQLEAGLASMNYYRKFVPHFSAIARPLNIP
ncbi:hypothetical protein C8Q69DRAFT_504802 [Paecilomyces variotii]|uniref:Uncharacterized protein n=1 Tax=Byssochlamys spectabilis TaxID=264951 RepID=A0A443I277_BYSSP|nr:hypothetical protein C8Q69DRAFT_504802 [Paecilomyces variotii]RWQ98156.1 hypothetical protein C8Q69DRAFT_504802 [Paecilomyces variotii]